MWNRNEVNRLTRKRKRARSILVCHLKGSETSHVYTRADTLVSHDDHLVSTLAQRFGRCGQCGWWISALVSLLIFLDSTLTHVVGLALWPSLVDKYVGRYRSYNWYCYSRVYSNNRHDNSNGRLCWRSIKWWEWAISIVSWGAVAIYEEAISCRVTVCVP